MLDGEKDDKAINPRQRDMIVAYLSYALEDVRAINKMGSQFLEMAIASLTEDLPDETALDAPVLPMQTATPH
jgi:hypothetical protein